MYQIAFSIGFIVSMTLIYANGDSRDYWAGVCIAMQTILVWWQIDNLLAIASIYLLAGITFLVFSVKYSGVALGIVSCLMCMLAVIAYLGFIPSDKGQGMAFNFYHWCTVLAWGQVGILGFMGYAGNNIRNPFI